MTVSTTTNKVSYSGTGSQTVFAYGFKIFADGDLDVYIRSSTGTETLQTITTHYTVSGAGSDSGGNVTFVTAPGSTDTVVIQRKLDLTQGTDYVANDPFPAASHEDALDRLTFITQQIQEEVDRSIKASVTNTISSSEFAISASDRANKIFAFDASGDLAVTQEIGTFRGNWAASTDYEQRDLVKDTSTNNIFIVNTAHTSSGAQPLTTNANSAKYDLIVDAASATTSATSAATSATAAATSATNAANSATAASTAQTAAETAQTAAETAKTGAETAQTAAESARDSALAAYDNFDDRYLGVKASDPTLDNDGNALVAGALYFNSTDSSMKVYDGSSWYDAYADGALFARKANNLSDLADAATARTNLGLGTAATSASTDFVAVTGDAMTGNLTFGDGNYVAFGDGLDLQIQHSGSGSFITDAGTGDLHIRADNNLLIQDAAGSTNRVTINSTGISVTGTALATTDTDTTNTGSVTLNFGANQNFVLTLTGNVTLANPTTEQVGQSGFIVFIQDATGGRTVSLGTDYETAGGAGLTLSTAASTTDIVPYVVAASGRILLGAPQLAFA